MAPGFVHRWEFDLSSPILLDTVLMEFIQMFSRRGAVSAEVVCMVFTSKLLFVINILAFFAALRESISAICYLLMLAGRGFGRRFSNDSGLS